MPRKRQLPKPRRTDRLAWAALALGDRLWLLMGIPCSARDPRSPLQMEDDVRESWALNREIAIAFHHQTFPGTMPGAWWRFDAPEPRDTTIDETVQLRRIGVVE